MQNARTHWQHIGETPTCIPPLPKTLLHAQPTHVILHPNYLSMCVSRPKSNLQTYRQTYRHNYRQTARQTYLMRHLPSAHSPPGSPSTRDCGVVEGNCQGLGCVNWRVVWLQLYCCLRSNHHWESHRRTSNV